MHFTKTIAWVMAVCLALFFGLANLAAQSGPIKVNIKEGKLIDSKMPEPLTALYMDEDGSLIALEYKIASRFKGTAAYIAEKFDKKGQKRYETEIPVTAKEKMEKLRFVGSAIHEGNLQFLYQGYLLKDEIARLYLISLDKKGDVDELAIVAEFDAPTGASFMRMSDDESVEMAFCVSPDSLSYGLVVALPVSRKKAPQYKAFVFNKSFQTVWQKDFTLDADVKHYLKDLKLTNEQGLLLNYVDYWEKSSKIIGGKFYLLKEDAPLKKLNLQPGGKTVVEYEFLQRKGQNSLIVGSYGDLEIYSSGVFGVFRAEFNPETGDISGLKHKELPNSVWEWHGIKEKTRKKTGFPRFYLNSSHLRADGDVILDFSPFSSPKGNTGYYGSLSPVAFQMDSKGTLTNTWIVPQRFEMVSVNGGKGHATLYHNDSPYLVFNYSEKGFNEGAEKQGKLRKERHPEAGAFQNGESDICCARLDDKGKITKKVLKKYKEDKGTISTNTYLCKDGKMYIYEARPVDGKILTIDFSENQ